MLIVELLACGIILILIIIAFGYPFQNEKFLGINNEHQ